MVHAALLFLSVNARFATPPGGAVTSIPRSPISVPSGDRLPPNRSDRVGALSYEASIPYLSLNCSLVEILAHRGGQK